jgi:hypothetical protein
MAAVCLCFLICSEQIPRHRDGRFLCSPFHFIIHLSLYQSHVLRRRKGIHIKVDEFTAGGAALAASSLAVRQLAANTGVKERAFYVPECWSDRLYLVAAFQMLLRNDVTASSNGGELWN